MRSSRGGLASAIVVGLLVVACSVAPSLAPSLAPSTTASPSGSPATAPPSPAPIGAALAPGRIAAGRDHTCAVTSGGGVKCWGSNGSGQLGNGTKTDSSTPVDVIGLAHGVTAVATGAFFTCALTVNQGVKCWGSADPGAIPTPSDIGGVDRDVMAIAGGDQHSCALTTQGGVKCWGANYTGELGIPPNLTPSPVAVNVTGLGSGVVGIAAGEGHSCALTSAGGVKCWGLGVYGELGDALNTDSDMPVDVTGLASGVTAIAAGGRNTCALTSGGGVKCWGETAYDLFSPLGNGSKVPVDVPGVTIGVVGITVGSGHACALMNGGTVRCWGGGAHGQLGNRATNSSAEAVDASSLGAGVVAIAGGSGHTCAAYDGWGVACVGDNYFGQLGIRTECTSTSVPVAASVEPDVVVPLPTNKPTRPPAAPIEHAPGSTDVVLRYDRFPDVGVSDLGGEVFQPGAEFTLYGDGTVIFRNEEAAPPASEGPLIRARPFRTAHLTEDQVQSLLRFALEDGGLEEACERYEVRGDTDAFIDRVHLVRAGGLDKRVLGGGLAELTDYLRNFDQTGGIPTTVFVPDAYIGNLLPAEGWIRDGFLPSVADAGAVSWPWPDIAPTDFVGLAPGEERRAGQRVMTAAEAAVIGLSDNGGLVKRIYLIGPDKKTVFSISLWPVLPGGPS
jgi:alpha-tubulin suppressor-like RCC1 family protein